MSDIIRKPAGAPGSTGGQFDGRTRTTAGGTLSLEDAGPTQIEKEALVKEYHRAQPIRKKLARQLEQASAQAEAALELNKIAENTGLGKFKGTVIGWDSPHIIVEDATGKRSDLYARELGVTESVLFEHIKNVNSKDFMWMRKNQHNKQLLKSGERRSTFSVDWEKSLDDINRVKKSSFEKDYAHAVELGIK